MPHYSKKSILSNLKDNVSAKVKRTYKRSKIHPTAIVHPTAELGKSVEIGAYSIIDEHVVLGDDTIVENHVTIRGDTVIGASNIIGPYTSIGLSAQDRAHRNEPTRVVIGDYNEIRENVTINRGTLSGTGITKIGNHNQIMINCHFGHDSSIGDWCMLANATNIGGHAQFGSYIVTGAVTGIHQFCKIGDYSMIGGLSGVVLDVPPFMTCGGQRAKVFGPNKIGLSRNGFNKDEVRQAVKLHKIFFRSGLLKKDAIQELKKQLPQERVLRIFLEFLEKSERGIMR
ncbi:MAG: UDP-N-acetylglucosamine acyltransferase [bacterium]|jgi:UDP-N-acetylglucosamine acyltransferase